MQKPQATEYGAHFAGYIQLVHDQPLIPTLEGQVHELEELLTPVTEAQGSYRYASGKWSIKEVIGHMNDTERIMTYRLLRVARGDATPLPGFDEKLFVLGAEFEQQTIKQLLTEAKITRQATLLLLDSIQEEAWQRSGVVSSHPITARALAYLTAGHWQHHRNVIEERYLSDLIK